MKVSKDYIASTSGLTSPLRKLQLLLWGVDSVDFLRRSANELQINTFVQQNI